MTISLSACGAAFIHLLFPRSILTHGQRTTHQTSHHALLPLYTQTPLAAICDRAAAIHYRVAASAWEISCSSFSISVMIAISNIILSVSHAPLRVIISDSSRAACVLFVRAASMIVR